MVLIHEATGSLTRAIFLVIRLKPKILGYGYNDSGKASKAGVVVLRFLYVRFYNNMRLQVA